MLEDLKKELSVALPPDRLHQYNVKWNKDTGISVFFSHLCQLHGGTGQLSVSCSLYFYLLLFAFIYNGTFCQCSK